MSKFLDFKECHPPGRNTRKTKVFAVVTKGSDQVLGTIIWYSPWRKYVYMPAKDTLYDPDCLDDISEFVGNLTNDHKAALFQKALNKPT